MSKAVWSERITPTTQCVRHSKYIKKNHKVQNSGLPLTLRFGPDGATKWCSVMRRMRKLFGETRMRESARLPSKNLSLIKVSCLTAHHCICDWRHHYTVNQSHPKTSALVTRAGQGQVGCSTWSLNMRYFPTPHEPNSAIHSHQRERRTGLTTDEEPNDLPWDLHREIQKIHVTNFIFWDYSRHTGAELGRELENGSINLYICPVLVKAEERTQTGVGSSMPRFPPVYWTIKDWTTIALHP